jgi:hypothetical protein
MIQRCQNAGFTLESSGAVVIVHKDFRKEFDRNIPAQFRIRGLIHLAHSPRAQVTGDFVMCEFGSDHDSKKIGRIVSVPLHIALEFQDGAAEV